MWVGGGWWWWVVGVEGENRNKLGACQLKTTHNTLQTMYVLHTWEQVLASSSSVSPPTN